MSDDHGKLPDDFGDLDWDSALDEWEKKSFDPAVATDAEKSAASLEAAAAASAEPAPAPAAPTSPPAAATTAASGARGSLGNLSSEGTVIAPVPRELRDAPRRRVVRADRPEPSPRLPATSSSPPLSAPPQRGSTPPAARGGLGQLFAKGASQRPPPPASPPQARPQPRPQPPRANAPSERTRVVPEAFPPPAALPRDDVPGARALADARMPSVTRQLASPALPRLEAFAEDPDGEDAAPTLVGRGLEDAESNAANAARAEAAERAPQAVDLDSSTMLMAERERLPSLSDAETQTRLPDEARPAPGARLEDEERTLFRPPSAPPMAAERSSTEPHLPVALPSAPHTERERPPAYDAPPEAEGELPASRWLDEATAKAFRQRASWLEEEARALDDATDQARALVGVSELLALVGDESGAFALASEARDLAPEAAMAWRQARQLLPRDASTVDARVAALDAEATRSKTPAARAHAKLVAADILRTNGDGDAAVELWSSACKLDPADVRAPAARAALALAQGNHSGAGNDLAENSELIALDRAVATALKLRGAQRAGTDVESTPINDGLRRARAALVAEDVVGAASAIADVAAEPSLSRAALWLSASLGATHIAGRRGAARSLKTLANDGEPLARRQLAARGIELGDPELVSAALAGTSEAPPFALAERVTLLALAGHDPTQELLALGDQAAFAPLVDALSALTAPADEAEAVVRSRRAAGTDDHRALGALGRLLASRPSAGALDMALANVTSPRSPAAAGVGLEVAVLTHRWDEVSEALSALPAGDDTAGHRHVAAALVAERAGNRENARRAWREALAEGAAHDSVVRAYASLDAEGSARGAELGTELLQVADVMPDGTAAAILRLEALARRDATGARPAGAEGPLTNPLDDDEQGGILERVHRGAPSLGIGAFLAERIGRRKGDVDEVLRWIQERRSYANDTLETALDAVREALLVADRDADLASTRLEEAHRARPDDVALRELYERLATEAPADRGAWRELRAAKASGASRALLFTEAALEHERAGDHASALRAAKAAQEAGDDGLTRLVADRAEIELGATERQTSELVILARDAELPEVRREAHERLAELDAHGKKDPAAAVLWHKTILEEAPRHKPSLRYVEQALVGNSAGADEELERVFEQIALALDGTGGGEVTGHAQLAARMKSRGTSGWERSADMARLAATQPEPSLWGLRGLNAHARIQKDEVAVLDTTLALLERTQRPAERSALLLRASEAAARLEQVADARAFLEQAANEDPGDVVTWGFLAEVRERSGEASAAAEACESLARTSVVAEHQLLAWFDAARIWTDEVGDTERGMTALEQCAEIDVTHGDVFQRLSHLYADKRLDAELARLLERRLLVVEDEGERVALEVELARALGEMGELAKAKASLESALAQRPDHTTALAAMAELCSKEGDWTGAEQAYVRLARLLDAPEEQRAIYEKLGEIYSVHAVNLSRAEVAYREVEKRAPNDVGTLEKLIDIYKRQGDTARAVETQQQIVAEASDPAVRLQRIIELAAIHEAARDARRSEQVLESARKEFPTSVVALRAMAEFYARQRQMPAMQILLDRAAGDARRSFAAGRFVTSLFQVLHAAYELRGKKDSARVVAATLAAVEGHPADIVGGEARAVDPRLDDILAPDTISPALRALFDRAGDALDAVSPLDLRALRATPLQPGTPLGTTIGAVATVVGLGALQILVSPQLGRVALPLGSNPPALLVGEGLMNVANERARAFVVVRAMKMILSRSSSLLRGQQGDVAVLVSALFTAFNPSFVPQGVDPKAVGEVSRRLVPALPRNLDPTVGVIALEAAGTLGDQAAMLGPATTAWANRVALLAIGDPNGALDAIAWTLGEEAAPRDPEKRAAWIARNVEARELMTFSVTDAYSEARARLGLDR